MKRAVILAGLALCAPLSLAACHREERAQPQPSTTTTNAKAPLTVPADLELPTSSAEGAPADDATVIYVSRSVIAVDDLSQPVVALDERGMLARVGVDARYKESGPHDLHIVPLDKAIAASRKKSGASVATPALLVVDAKMPFHVVGEVIFTAQRAGVKRFQFLVRGAGGANAALDLGIPPGALYAPPALPDAGPEGGLPKDAKVLFGINVQTQGFALRAFGRELGPDCEPGGGVTVPLISGAYDAAGLTRCASKKKGMVPDTTDDLVTVGAAPEVDTQAVILALDALRTTEAHTKLFPTAAFVLVR